ELSNRLDQAEKSRRAAGLSHRELSAAGVDWKGAVRGEGMPADELRPGPLLAKTQILDLNDGHHRIIVIGLHEVDVGGFDTGRCIQMLPVEDPAAAGLNRI